MVFSCAKLWSPGFELVVVSRALADAVIKISSGNNIGMYDAPHVPENWGMQSQFLVF